MPATTVGEDKTMLTEAVACVIKPQGHEAVDLKEGISARSSARRSK
jgi:hypothetical protein